MTNPYDAFALSEKAEQEGIWLEYGDFRIRVGHAGPSNPKFTKTVEKVTRPVRKALEKGLLDSKRTLELNAEVYAKALILDWHSRINGEWQKGIVMKDGQLHDFNVENVKKVLLDLPALQTDIQDQASSFANFREAENEADLGN